MSATSSRKGGVRLTYFNPETFSLREIYPMKLTASKRSANLWHNRSAICSMAIFGGIGLLSTFDFDRLSGALLEYNSCRARDSHRSINIQNRQLNPVVPIVSRDDLIIYFYVELPIARNSGRPHSCGAG